MTRAALLRLAAAASLLLATTALADAGTGRKAAKASDANAEAADNMLGIALMSAVVEADGNVARGIGIETASRLGAGSYAVYFERNVRNCTYTVNSGEPDTVHSPTFGSPAVSGLFNDVTGVYVRMFNPDGALIDKGFHLFVFCGA